MKAQNEKSLQEKNLAENEYQKSQMQLEKFAAQMEANLGAMQKKVAHMQNSEILAL